MLHTISLYIMYQFLITTTISETNFTQHSTSSETCSYLPGQEILHLLWNPNVHDCSQEPISIPSYLNPFHPLTLYFVMIFIQLWLDLTNGLLRY